MSEQQQAIIRTGGKQYRVSPGSVLKVEKLPGGDDTRAVDPLPELGMRQYLIERETEVADPCDGLLFVCRLLQAPDQTEYVAGPQ